MQRTVYTDGRILQTADFVADQAYHLARHRQHNTGQHSWGIVTGLRILLQDGGLVVEPGRAVDGFGRDVLLDHVGAVDLTRFDLLGIEEVAVWLVYDRNTLPATGDGVDRISESATVETSTATADDGNRDKPPGVSDADLVFGAQNPPDDPARRWPVYLGRITRDLTRPADPPVIDLNRRPYAGLVGASVTSPDHGTWLDLGTAGPGAVSIGLRDEQGEPVTALTVAASGVEVTGPLAVDGDLTVHGGTLTVAPSPPELTAPVTPTPDWSVSHADNDVAHELRVTMPAGGTVPSRLTVGSWQDGAFRPSLTIDETGTVVITGNLIVSGFLQAAAVHEGELNDEARRYLAGLQSGSLLALFSALPPEIG